ncbi:MAG: P27 family phage terminase small subunit, partial [Mesorhizobium sp.]
LDVWNRLAPRVIGMKLLFPIDAETFGRYCRNFARWLKMQQRLDEMGEIYEIETASGKVRRADPSFIIGYH